MAGAIPISQIPEVGNAPVQAPSLGELASLESVPQANTAVLPNQNAAGGLNDQILRAGQIRYAMQQAKHQQEQENIAKSIAHTFQTGDLFPEDVQIIDNEKNKLLDWTKQNAKGLASGDLVTQKQFQQKAEDIDFLIKKFSGDKEWTEKQNEYLNNPTNIANGYGTPEDKLHVEEFRKQKGTERNWQDYSPRTFFNPHTFNQELSNYVGTGKEYEVEKNTGVGNQTEKVKIVATEPQKISTGLDDLIKSNNGKQALQDYLHTMQLAQQNPDNPNFNPTITIYDLTQDRDKNGNLVIKEQKKLSEGVGFKDWLANYSVPAVDKSNFSKTLQGAQSSLANGDGKKKTVIALEEKIPVNIQAVNPETTTIVNPNNKTVTSPPTQINLINGHNFASQNEKPKNVNINSPERAYDPVKNKWIKPTTADLWNVDIVADGTVYFKQNPNGTRVWYTDKTKGADTEKMVQVKDAKGKTFFIPFDGGVKSFIEQNFDLEQPKEETTSTPKTLKTKSGITFTVQ